MNKTKTEQQQEPSKERELVAMLLDSYFQYRTPAPQSGAVREPKTTIQIQDELEPMAHVDIYDIATWMLQHSYVPTTEADGTVTWEIYRMVTTDL